MIAAPIIRKYFDAYGIQYAIINGEIRPKSMRQVTQLHKILIDLRDEIRYNNRGTSELDKYNLAISAISATFLQ